MTTLTQTLAQKAIGQNTMAFIAACIYKRQFSLYIAANYGTVESRQFGIKVHAGLK